VEGQRAVAHGDTLKILLADDDEASRSCLQEALTRYGMSVDCAPSGEIAVEMATHGDYALACIDVLMPGMSGLEVCRVIKGLTQFTPVILLAARTDNQSRIEGLRVGADDLLGRPIDEGELLLKLTRLTTLKKLNDEIAHVRARFEEVSTLDSETGIASYRQLGVRLQEEFRRSERYHDPIACILINIDARTVDASGHFAVQGSTLRSIATTIRSALREIDVVARYGPSEIVVLLPSTHFVGALVVAERLFSDLTALTIEDDARARIVVSAGVSMFPSRDVHTRFQLLSGAESALFRSKMEGGGRICVFQHQGYIYSTSSSEK
jgi:diguanylate cyclase (GGDEF)-like protein